MWVNGKIVWVLSNFEWLCVVKCEFNFKLFKFEVQFIKFQYNQYEVEVVCQLVIDWGVDVFMDFWGDVGNFIDYEIGMYEIYGLCKVIYLLQCFFLYMMMVIKYNGDVIFCCCYWFGDQYWDGGDMCVIGNVFEISVKEVWWL